jgi:hypothetical protein
MPGEVIKQSRMQLSYLNSGPAVGAKAVTLPATGGSDGGGRMLGKHASSTSLAVVDDRANKRRAVG